MSLRTAVSNSTASHSPAPPVDPRSRLPAFISRFLGYRSGPAPYAPLPFFPFNQLHHIPLQVETWFFGFIGAFVSILLIEAVMQFATPFRGTDAPLIVVSFGASAVLVFGVVESPLAQPQNLVMGQVVSAFVGVALTKLFCTGDAAYTPDLDARRFEGGYFTNGALSMATAMLAQQLFGITHPPAGATSLSAATTPQILHLGWMYLLLVLVSSLIMLGWALIINNLGRRRYPAYWIKSDGIFAIIGKQVQARRQRRIEARRQTREGKGAEEGRAEGQP